MSHSVLPVSQEAAGIARLSGWRDQDSQSRANVSWTPGSMLVWSECRRVLAAWPGLRAGAGVPALGLASSFPFLQVPRGPADSPLAGSFKLSQLLSRNRSEIVAGSPQLLLKPASSPPVSTSSWGRWFLAATLPRRERLFIRFI